MTQKELIMLWLQEHGELIPAKVSGVIYHEIMFGSETSKRCREMRKAGVLGSRKEGKFEIYHIKPRVELPAAYKEILDNKQSRLL